MKAVVSGSVVTDGVVSGRVVAESDGEVVSGRVVADGVVSGRVVADGDVVSERVVADWVTVVG